MSETKTIKYGGSNLALTPSENLVAVPDAPSSRTFNTRAVSASTMLERDGAEEIVKLGPFRIVSTEPTSQNAEMAVRRFNSAISRGVPAQNATRVYHTSDDGVPFVPSGEIYLQFEEGFPVEEINELLKTFQLEVLKDSGERGVIVRGSQDAVEVCSRLQDVDGVELAEPELMTPGQLRQLSSDPKLEEQWYLENKGIINGNGVGLVSGADARVVAAWEKLGHVGSSNVVVAVIDDGFDLMHPDLGPNSRIVSPFNFEDGNTDVSPQISGPNSLRNPIGGDWHGTACAGVAVGSNDQRGIVGAAPNSRFMPIRWSPYITDNFIERAFAHAKNHGADVVSCSWGVEAAVFRLSTRMKNAIADCARNGRGGRGCVICFAAGNSNHDVNNPPFSLDGFSIHPDVISVAASTSVDTRSHYSNFGNEISVCAPSSGYGGRGVLTADVQGYYTYRGSRYFAGYSPVGFTESSTSYLFGGTSSSCPLVAGICALILSVDPSLTSAEVKEIIQDTARKIGNLASYNSDGHSVQHGYGCVDAEAAVKAAIARKKPYGKKSKKR